MHGADNIQCARSIENHTVLVFRPLPCSDLRKVLPTGITDKAFIIARDDWNVRHICQGHAFDDAIEILIWMGHNRLGTGKPFPQRAANAGPSTAAMTPPASTIEMTRAL